MAELAKLLIVVGVILVLAGVIFLALGRLPLLGRLPGDLLFRRGNVSFYFPIVTCILVSIALTALLNLLARLFR